MWSAGRACPAADTRGWGGREIARLHHGWWIDGLFYLLLIWCILALHCLIFFFLTLHIRFFSAAIRKKRRKKRTSPPLSDSQVTEGKSGSKQIFHVKASHYLTAWDWVRLRSFQMIDYDQSDGDVCHCDALQETGVQIEWVRAERCNSTLWITTSPSATLTSSMISHRRRQTKGEML